jgi:hypothetical protein
MRTQYVRRSFFPFGQSLTLNSVLALFALVSAYPAAAQPDTAVALDENLEVGPAAVPLRRTVARSSMPDAPSASHLNSRSETLTFAARSRIYAHSIFNPYTLVGPALGAGVGQAENEPPEWKQGAAGYARRFESGLGRHLIEETVRFGAAAADGENPQFKRSDEAGVWNRARHAILETFTSQTSRGSRMPAYSRFAGTYGAAFISNMWYPGPQATTGWALRRGSTALGSCLGFHLFEEFVPRKYYEALHAEN